MTPLPISPPRPATSYVWSFGLFEVDDLDLTQHARARELLFVPGGRLTRGLEYVHTNADPFLFARNGVLYVFYESVSRSKKGVIKAISTTDLSTFRDLGVILQEDFHLSYPHVLSLGSDVYMLPESSEAGRVCLYGFKDFPFRPEFCRTLLVGDYVDSSIFHKEGTYYLFATSPKGLELFTSRDPVREEFVPHRANPITSDLRYSRCGGRILTLGTATYRIAQDCSVQYGMHLNAMEIVAISPSEYQERPAAGGLKLVDKPWLAHGSHHLDSITFANRRIIATDGRSSTTVREKVQSVLSRLKP